MSGSMMDALEAANAAEKAYHEANAELARMVREYLDGQATHDELADASADAQSAAAAREAARTAYQRHGRAST